MLGKILTIIFIWTSLITLGYIMFYLANIFPLDWLLLAMLISFGAMATNLVWTT